ncbi:MAG: amino acid ABC transporter substrate-binding protein [Burkholderiales bacterium]
MKTIRELARALLSGAVIGLLIGSAPLVAHAQSKAPIRIGMSIAQTGALSGAGKSGLLALQMWREDVNKAGGLLGRPVELVVYDDQTNPSTSPGLYTKLLDVDKVDLLIGPYGTNVTAPIMPLVKRRDLLLMGNFPLNVNAAVRHDKFFNNIPVASGRDWAVPYFDIAARMGAKKVAILAADAEFAQTLVEGARAELKLRGLELVYDQNYPPATVDFSSVMRAMRAKGPEAVFVASYPPDSAAIIRALNEIGVGDSVKLFGGGMVGLQFATLMESLGPLLNGVVNYTFWAPEKTMDFPGMRDFLTRYQARAKEAGVDPLGYYLPPYDYAIGQMLAQAVIATGSLDHKILAQYLRTNEMKTIVGNFRFGPSGEWEKPRVVYVQFRDVVERNIDQFRKAGRQVIVAPEIFKTGEVKPFGAARQ